MGVGRHSGYPTANAPRLCQAQSGQEQRSSNARLRRLKATPSSGLCFRSQEAEIEGVHDAAKKGDVTTLVRLLLEKPALVNCKDSVRGHSPAPPPSRARLELQRVRALLLRVAALIYDSWWTNILKSKCTAKRHRSSQILWAARWGVVCV